MLQLQTSKFKSGFFAALILAILLAADAQALTISPARIELVGNPGGEVRGEFLLINEEGDAKTFYSSVQNFEAQGESGTPNFTDAKEGLASWVSVEQQVTLKRGEQLTIPFTVTIPPDADPGGYFAAIFLSTAPPQEAGGQVSVGAKIGSLVLLRVAGDIKEEGGIASFETTEGGSFFTTLPVSFSYRFTNAGGDRINPAGTITMRNMLGIKVDSIDANPTDGNVLPGSTRKFSVDWGEAREGTGFFNAVKYQWKHFAIGPYFAHIALTYGATGTDKATKILFMFPWQLLLILILILGALYLILGRGIRRYNQWIIKKAQRR